MARSCHFQLFLKPTLEALWLGANLTEKGRSRFPLVMDRPDYLPALAAVQRAFPGPIELIGSDVFVDHALKHFCPVGPYGFALQHHLPILELANEIKITTLVVDPGLLPFARPRVKKRNTYPAQVHRRAAVEILLDNAAVQHPFNAVRSTPGLAAILARPREIPLAKPEIELPLLWLAARRRLRWSGTVRLFSPTRGLEHHTGGEQSEEKKPDDRHSARS